jgi:DNA uptake protein ComE-like DNA-binding protein
MKSHFQFSKKQRNGIFVLILILIGLQCIYVFVDFSEETLVIPQNELERYRAEVDSLRLIELENSKPKIFPFNPNYITDYKGYTLGMTNQEIDRLLEFRKTDRWVNSTKDFQNITKISDSLLAVISPYFKFPEWVTNPKPKQDNYNNTFSNNDTPKTDQQKIDLNEASAIQLQKVYGIGVKTSERIIKYRNKFEGGFSADAELIEVWGLSHEVIKRIKNDFTVKTPRKIMRFNINTATRDELVKIPHIDYEIANNIIEERVLREGFKFLNDLTKVEQFPLNKLEIIKLYLHL